MPAAGNVPTEVVVHPIVLLSTVDHYNRIARGTRKRVVGVLLGEVSKGRVDVTNSYAVPFEEDEHDQAIWFLDHNFHENMCTMFRKVQAKEKVVGWYSSGPKIRPSDLAIHAKFTDYTPNPVFVIIDVAPTDALSIPTEAYVALEEVKEDGKDSKPKMEFQHIPSEIGAYEAEEIGVEHLLRDVKDTSISTLAQQVDQKVASLKGLAKHLREMQTYLDNVLAGKLPVNHDILARYQDVFNLLPNVHLDEMVKSFAVKSNDMLLVIYVSSMIRSVIALHNLVNNKIANRDAERKELEAEAGKENKDKSKRSRSSSKSPSRRRSSSRRKSSKSPKRS